MVKIIAKMAMGQAKIGNETALFNDLVVLL